ncbi:FAD-dependent monooxygenase [Corallococcus sp. bb12-1]|uniref:FAD-dependent monooxygenase n=1 Tax=Corallococcus sp. bb12-1 TaxID=2996784 RepID=UPI0022708C33|nr:FAD-dependent monooxygenase [Corallococcus sp. bb12-1]MCY1047773.1 FAD-dependent monooxygenase [Corallococcus sp. bb12-1]
MSDPTEVLIVGAGPVGLCLALALDQQGVRVRIIDKEPSFSGESKAVTLQPRTLEIFQMLGVADRLLKDGVINRVMNMHVGRERVTVLRYDRLDSAFAFYLHLHQGQTERVLVQVLGERGITVERATALEGLHQDAGGVTARLVRTGGGSEEITVPFLVGCDGGHSRVRAALDLGFSGARHDDNWIMTDVRIPNMSLARDERHGFILDRFPFVVLNLGNDYYRLIAARPPGSPLAGQVPTLEEFRDIMTPLGLGHWQLEAPLWLTHYRPSQRLVSQYRVGRVFVAGDAAHVNTPIAAQGLNTGVLDAINLAWKLRFAVRGKASTALLDSYHAERHAAAVTMFAQNDRLTTLVFGANPLLRFLARKQLHLLNLPALNLRNVLGTSQLDVHYRHSPVVQPALDPRGTRASRASFERGGARPGDRAPHLLLDAGTATPLYEVLRADHHTLLILGGERPDTAAMRAMATHARDKHGEWLTSHFVFNGQVAPGFDGGGLGKVWTDAHGKAHRALGVKRAGCVVIRPDAHLATRFPLGAPEGLDTYFGALLH